MYTFICILLSFKDFSNNVLFVTHLTKLQFFYIYTTTLTMWLLPCVSVYRGTICKIWYCLYLTYFKSPFNCSRYIFQNSTYPSLLRSAFCRGTERVLYCLLPVYMPLIPDILITKSWQINFIANAFIFPFYWKTVWYDYLGSIIYRVIWTMN